MSGGLDYNEFMQLLNGFKGVQKEFEAFLRSFLKEMGLQAIAQTKKLTPVDTGRLRNAWELSDVFRRGDELYIVLFNAVEYALWIEEGHRQERRFVPGKWAGGRFEYIPGHKGGMMLNDKWIPGYHMARISVTKIEQQLPKKFDRAFKQFCARMGAE